MPCPACLGNVWREAYSTPGGEYVRCAGCRLVRIEPMPTREMAAGIFSAAYFEGGVTGGYRDYPYDEPLHRMNARDRLGRVARERGPEPGRWLDVGCAHGFMLDEARLRGWEVTGVEVSRSAREWCAKRLAMSVSPSLEELAAESPDAFDVISFFQSLAHVVDPAADLALSRQRIGDDGLLVIETWDADSRVARVLGSRWHEVNPPSILYLHNRSSMSRLLERAGFSMHSFRRTSKLVSFGAAASIVEQRVPTVGRTLGAAVRRLGLADRGVRYSVGDLVTVLARPS